MKFSKIVGLFCSLLLANLASRAQQTGYPPFGSFGGGSFDGINLQNLNVNFSIPIISSAGRGGSLTAIAGYNSLLWQINTVGSTKVWSPVVDAAGNPTWGWNTTDPIGTLLYSAQSNPAHWCPNGQSSGTGTLYTNFRFVESDGTAHPFSGLKMFYYPAGGCPGWTTQGASQASDNSGFAVVNPTALRATGTLPNVWSPDGTKILPGIMIDRNGNQVSRVIVNSSETDWKDSVGRIAAKIIKGTSSIQYQFLDGSGTNYYKTATLYLTSYPIQTNFACSAVSEYTGTASLPSELDIPTPSGAILKYFFYYEVSPANSSKYTGRLLKVVLPAGGSYKYEYSGANNGINCQDGSALNLKRSVYDNSSTGIWQYIRTGTFSLTTTVTDPASNDQVYTFRTAGGETQRQYYTGTGGSRSLLRTINTTWSSSNTPTRQVTILEDNSTQSEVDTTFNNLGYLTSKSEYDWGAGVHGGLLRSQTLTYQSGGSYPFVNLFGLVTSNIISDGNGVVQFRQDVTYDGTAITNCPPGVPQHDDTNYGCDWNSRGNATSDATYLSPATQSNPITKNFVYDVFGNLIQSQPNCCQYMAGNYSSTTQYALPDSVVRGSSPTQLTVSATYNPDTGQIATATDENGQVSHYYYDFLHRLTRLVRPDNAQITTSFDDTNFTTTSTTPIDSSQSVQRTVSLDGLGRPVTVTTKDAGNTVYSIVATNYDAMGRAFRNSNPYTGSPQFWTTTTYDALGRATALSLPDGSQTSYLYATNSLTTTDPAGLKSKSVIDAAGRVITLFEPDVTQNNQLTQQTSYSYNVGDKIVGIAQGGETRSYTYDSVGRLTDSTTPDTGHFQFQYNNFNLVTQRTDARGVVTTYSYDNLNRPYQTIYNVGSTGVPATPTITLTYGTSAAQNNNGRLITMTDGSGSENYSYDILGNLTQMQKVINSITYTTQYQYNLAEGLKQITYPSNRVVLQSFDAIGRLCAVGALGSACATGSTYATGYGYNVASQVTGFKYGNGIYASLGFSFDRLQLGCLDYSTTNRNGTCTHDSTTKFGLTYGYPSAPNNNGQIARITDNVDNGRTVAYTYDPLSRLSTALTTGSTNYPQWGLSWGYDRYGNRLNQTLTAGSGYQGSVQVSASSNRINCIGSSGQSCTGGVIPTYDANGNMTYDGTNTLLYDAENHATSATNQSSAGTYTYDGKGLRVKKVSGGTTTIYIFSGSKVIAEYDSGAPPAGPTREYVYGGEALISRMGSIDVRFTNDSCSACGGNPVGGGDRNLYVNSITAGSTVIPPSDPSVSYTVPSCDGPWGLGCTGDMITTSSAAESAQTITVNAYGSPDYNIYPHMQLLVGGNIVGQWDVTGTAQNYTVTLQSTSTQYFLKDHLSNRLVIDSAGNAIEQMGHFPFGESWYNATSDKLLFTSYERDSESGNDYALARYYVNRLGRFSSPDPIAGSVDNPQSFNGYAYTKDNPINLVDPLGLDSIDPFKRASRKYPRYPPRHAIACGYDQTSMYDGGGCTLDFSCQIDGFSSSCAVAFGSIGAGAAIACPDNDCKGFRANASGLWKWVPGGEVSSRVGQDAWTAATQTKGFWQYTNTFWTFFGAYWQQVPWSATVSVDPVQFPVSYIPGSNTMCVGFGPAASVSPPDVPASVNGGPLLFGDLNKAKDVLSGFGVNWSAQPLPGIGYQGTLNFSGQLHGPTAGPWGASLGFTYSGCWDLK